MKKKKVALFIFIDAFGWEILRANPSFLSDILVDRKKLNTILGYSSACDPSIISGQFPSQHRYWSSFYYSPKTSPYKWIKWLSFLPKPITNHHRVRHVLSRLIKKIHGFTGYFQLYNVPFSYLPYFDYAEKMSIWKPEGLNRSKTIFSHLTEKQIPYYVGDSEPNDESQLNKVSELLEKGAINFSYLLMGKLDALMHSVGTSHSKVNQLLNWYDQQIRLLLKKAQTSFEEVSLYIFTDHGMHNVREAYNLQDEIDKLKLTYGKDYVALYDSTMGRFWFMNDLARRKIEDCLRKIEKGSIMSRMELQSLGVYFPDHQYGEMIFLMNPGVLIVPSFMGMKKIPGMHGYHPEEPDSYAMICSNRPLPKELNTITDIYKLMLSEAS